VTATEEQLADGPKHWLGDAAQETRDAIERAKADGPEALARVVTARLLRIEVTLNAMTLRPHGDVSAQRAVLDACEAVGSLRALRRVLRGLP
jgi:hypothetical protein